MMSMITVPIVTDASGDFATRAGPIMGPIHQWRYVPDGSSPLDTGADLDITGDISGIVIADIASLGTSAITRAPRQPTHAADGSASLYAATGEPVEDKIVLAGEDIDIVVANGGNTLRGTLYIWFG